MNDVEIRALSQKLRPLAVEIHRILSLTGVPLPILESDLTPGYDHATDEFTFGQMGPGEDSIICLGPPKAQPGALWTRRFGAPQELGTEPIEAVSREWQNDSDSDIPVVLDEIVEIQSGVQKVKTNESAWGSNWEVGGSVSTKLATEASASASYMGVSAEAKVSAEVSATIEAKGGGQKSGSSSDQDQTHQNKNNTRQVKQTFEVPPRTHFRATAMYDKVSLSIPYVDTLPIDMTFKCRGMHLGGTVYDRYYRKWHGSDYRIYSTSILGWLGGFFGAKPPDCDDFQPGIDITFSQDPRDAMLRDRIDSLRGETGALTVQREGTVVYANASAERYITKQEPL